jgi:two-component system, NtrC family, sensor histidine kinase HydH
MGIRLLLRIMAPTIALAAALLLFGGMAAWYLHRMQAQAEEMLAASFERGRVAADLEALAHKIRSEMRESLLTGNSDRPADLWQLRRQADGKLAEAESGASCAREREYIAAAAQAYRRLFTALEPAEATTTRTGRHAADYRANVPLATAVITAAAEYRTFNQQQAARAAGRLRGIAGNMLAALLLLGLCGSVAGLLVGVAVIRGMQRAMGQLAEPIRTVSDKLGEVAGPIPLVAGTTFEQLEGALHGLSSQAGTVVECLHESHRATARAEQMAAVGQLAAGLAHELRNPLMAMKILLQTAMEDGPAGGLQGRDLEVMEEEISRLDLTLRAFLDYARPPRLDKQPILVRDLVTSTVELLARQARECGVEIQVDVPARVVAVRADGGQLRQVLLNLLLNALEASPSGSVVSVRLRFVPEAADNLPDAAAGLVQWVEVEVADRGSGIAAELGERIFEPFFSSKATGTGLGLPICRRIAQAHGGQITADNRPGGGAVFTLRLPVGRTELASLEAATLVAVNGEAGSPPASTIKPALVRT